MNLKFKYRLPYGRQRLLNDWIKALRSGKYKQGRFFLCQPYPGEGFKYCALGVLGEVATDFAWGYAYDICSEFLKIPFPIVSNQNDTAKLTFTQIANWLERDYL